MDNFLENWTALSNTGLVGGIFDILYTAGDWAGAVADLIGLL